MPEHLTEDEVRQRLRDLATSAGGVSAWAKARQFTPQYVSGVIGGTRPLSPRILGELGLARIVHYVQKEPPRHGESSIEKSTYRSAARQGRA